MSLITISPEVMRYVASVASALDDLAERSVFRNSATLSVSKVTFALDGEDIEVSLIPNEFGYGFDIKVDADE